MHKINIINTGHRAFLKMKNASHFVFILLLAIVISAQSNIAFGESVVPKVETEVRVYFDDQEKTFTATQNTVEGALEQGGITLNQYDITLPQRNALLVGGDITVNVTRALPVLISDGNQTHIAFSAYTDPAEILQQLEITTYPEDKIDAELITDPVDDMAVGQKVIIERAPVFVVNVDDSEVIVRSWGKTIGEVLNGKVSMGPKDIIEPAVDTLASEENNQISITRVNEAEIEELETIEFETIIRNDYSLYQGQTKTTQEGSDGQKRVNYKVIYHNGVEIDRIVLNSELLSSPVSKIVVKGLKPYNAGMWWDTLVSASNRYPNNSDLTPDKMFRVMTCESGGNPFAGGYYKGLFQYSPDTWAGASIAAGYGGAAITDGTAQIYVTAWKVNNDGGWYAWGCKP